MKVDLYSVKGEKLREFDVDDSVFAVKVSEGSIYHAVNSELANMRAGTAETKTRGRVRGTTAKPWRQKGTGRARAGRWRSPVRVGGGVVFGPHPRDYTVRLPKKIKRLAMKSILSLKMGEGALKFVEDFTVDTGKTKDLVSLLKTLVPAEKTVLLLKDDDAMLKRAARNIPWLSFLSYDRLRAHDLFYGKHVVCMEGAAKNLSGFYGPVNSQGD